MAGAGTTVMTPTEHQPSAGDCCEGASCGVPASRYPSAPNRQPTSAAAAGIVKPSLVRFRSYSLNRVAVVAT